jgi:hypothetical protein
MELITLVSAHLRLKGAVDYPLLGDFSLAAPEANSQPGQVSGPKRSRFGYFWSLDGYTENVGLELHEQVIDDGPAINTQCLEIDTTISRHGFQHISGLVAHRFQGGACNMPNR